VRRNKISASILSADFSNLGNEVRTLSNAGVDSIHLDIMDGKFVPNISFGPQVVKSIRKETKLPFKVHLMVEEPELYIQQFVDAGAETIIFHIESTRYPHNLIKQIKNYGVKVGVALNPSTSESSLEYIYNELNEILVMTVNPGFSGQQFINSQLEKINKISSMIFKNDLIDLGVDGGINPDTLKRCSEKGANLAIVGDYLFAKDSIQNNAKNIVKSFNNSL
jgi:ribulose-phosphate 3-epimerase